VSTLIGYLDEATGAFTPVSTIKPLPVVATGGGLPVVAGSITTQNLVPAGVATAGSAIEYTCGEYDTLSIQVTGVYTGALSAQGTVDGSNWVTLSGGSQFINMSNGAQVGAITSAAVGIYQIGLGGFLKVRITGLAAMTGTAAVTIRGVEGNGMVALDAPLPVGTNTLGGVNLAASFSGSSYAAVTTASTNAASIKATAGNIYELAVSNLTAAIIYVKLYAKATAPVVGTDIPVLTIPVGIGALFAMEFGMAGKRVSPGIGIAVTANAIATDATAVAAGAQIHLTYA
jgi:hypothetical protein